MLAAPMARDQLHLLGLGFVQRGVVQQQQTAVAHLRRHQLLRFMPQRLGVGRLSGQQAGEGIMSRCRAASVQEKNVSNGSPWHRSIEPLVLVVNYSCDGSVKLEETRVIRPNTQPVEAKRKIASKKEGTADSPVALCCRLVFV